MFTVNANANGKTLAIASGAELSLEVTGGPFPRGTHLEVKFSDDGAVFVEIWDGCEGEFTASRTITFEEMLDEGGYLDD